MTSRARTNSKQKIVGTRKVTKIWTTGDGVRVRICDMTDTHLRNAIRSCERLHKQMQRDLPYPMFGGEMAQYYAEQDYERFQESDPEESFPLYLDLHAEADRRGLKV